MRTAYRVTGMLISLMVVVQAAAIAFGVFGLWHDVDAGNAIDKNYDGNGGFAIHSIGAMVVAVLAIVFLVLSFLTKVPGAPKWAGITFGLVLLQWVLGIVSFSAPVLGALHAINAFGIAAVAGIAGARYSGRETAPPAAPPASTVPA